MLTVRESFQPSHVPIQPSGLISSAYVKGDTVHFSGNKGVPKSMPLKTLFMMVLLGSGLPVASAFPTGNRHRHTDPSSITATDTKDLSSNSVQRHHSRGTAHLSAFYPAFTPFQMTNFEPMLTLDGSRNEPLKEPDAEPSLYSDGVMLQGPDDALQLAKTGQIAEAPDALKVITGPGHEKLLYEIRLKNGTTVGLLVPQNAVEHQQFLQKLKGDFIVQPKETVPKDSKLLSGILGTLVPLLSVMGLLYAAKYQMNGINKIQTQQKPQDEVPITFDDIRGYPEVVRELKRVKGRYLKEKQGRGVSGIQVKPLKGILLEGPPGTGKTMMAKALAEESGASFHYVSGSQFGEMWKGVGANRVRDLFAQAKAGADKCGGAIIFIDELDSIGGKRDNGATQRISDDEHSKILTELLQQIDGFSSDPRIMVLAATNLADKLDGALLRSGRFDKKIRVDLPRDKEQRRDILEKYLAEHPTAKKLDRDAMAELTAGKSGADLKNLVNQMAEAAVDRISEATENPAKAPLLHDPEFHKLNTIDFMEALRNMNMGMKRKTQGTEAERKTVAVHEVVGHGLVARAAKVPLHIVSMQARGDALGHVMIDSRGKSIKLPTLESILKDLVISMGGRASEREMLGPTQITPGARGDIAQSKTQIRQMLAARMLPQASGADYYNENSMLNEHDRKVVDSLFKQAEQTAQEVIRTVPPEKLWGLVNKALSLDVELDGDAANAFYQEIIDTVGADKLYKPINQFIQDTAGPPESENETSAC